MPWETSGSMPTTRPKEWWLVPGGVTWCNLYSYIWYCWLYQNYIRCRNIPSKYDSWIIIDGKVTDGRAEVGGNFRPRSHLWMIHDDSGRLSLQRKMNGRIAIWRFPKIGVPNHPIFLIGVSIVKPSILPPCMETSILQLATTSLVKSDGPT